MPVKRVLSASLRVSFILALGLTAALLAGCGSAASTPAPSTPAPDGSNAVSKPLPLEEFLALTNGVTPLPTGEWLPSTLAVTGGDWSFVDLSGADLSRARFDGTRLREAGLAGVKAAGATLRHVDLSAATTDGADFTGADLRGSDLTGINPLTVSLRGAVITWDQAVQVAESLGLHVRPDDA